MPQSRLIDWGVVVREAADEKVLPGLACRLREMGIEHEVPLEILHVFDSAALFNSDRNQVIIDEAVHAAALLNQIGIQPMALKGLAYLLLGVYPNSGTRYLEDIDLLVQNKDLSRAVSHLRKFSYFKVDSEPFIRFRHHYPAMRRAGRSLIELHHRVGQGVCDRLLPPSLLFADARTLSINGSTFLLPSPSSLANHLILHSQLAHPYSHRIFPSMRALVDLAELQKRFSEEIDWRSLLERYESEGESATLSLHLQHAKYFLGANLPVPKLPALRWHRRLLLNRYPKLRFFDPIYLLMSLFSRRLRLVPDILRHPASWPKVLRTLTSSTFYRNLFAL